MTYNITEDGHWVSAETQRIAQIIHDYDPNLELAWIPPENRELNDTKPFAVMHTDRTGKKYVVMTLTEGEVDHRVLARLWAADNQNGNVLSDLEATQAAHRAIEMQRTLEAQEEAREKAAWMIKAPVGARIDGMRLE